MLTVETLFKNHASMLEQLLDMDVAATDMTMAESLGLIRIFKLIDKVGADRGLEELEETVKAISELAITPTWTQWVKWYRTVDCGTELGELIFRILQHKDMPFQFKDIDYRSVQTNGTGTVRGHELSVSW